MSLRGITLFVLPHGPKPLVLKVIPFPFPDTAPHGVAADRHLQSPDLFPLKDAIRQAIVRIDAIIMER